MPTDFLETVEQRAKQFYTDLPYHNFTHVQNAVQDAEKLLNRCEQYDVPVDRRVVLTALYFHDAGYHENHEEKGFETKERYSAAIAETVLQDLGCDPQFIEDVQTCILATEPDAMFETNEEKLVRAADLHRMAASYPAFKKNAEKLRAEYEQLHGETLSRAEWINKTRQVIQHYLSQDIRLTPEHDNEHGESIFHKKAAENLEQYQAEKQQA